MTPTLALLNAKATAIYGAADERYRLLIVARCKHAGDALRPGQLRLVEHLRDAAELVRRKQARPADQRTANDVALFNLLRITTPCATSPDASPAHSTTTP